MCVCNELQSQLKAFFMENVNFYTDKPILRSPELQRQVDCMRTHFTTEQTLEALTGTRLQMSFNLFDPFGFSQQQADRQDEIDKANTREELGSEGDTRRQLDTALDKLTELYHDWQSKKTGSNQTGREESRQEYDKECKRIAKEYGLSEHDLIGSDGTIKVADRSKLADRIDGGDSDTSSGSGSSGKKSSGSGNKSYNSNEAAELGKRLRDGD